MSGVKVGNGACIAANSTVIKDISAYEIWGGNPAKKLKTRFSLDIIESLQKLRWWDLKVEVIQKLAQSLSQAPDAESVNEIARKAKKLSEEA